MQTRLAQVLVPFIIGAAVMSAGSAAIAITSAIAAPAWFFGLFKSFSLLPLGLLAWDILVTYGLAVVLPSVALLLASYRFRIAPSLLGTGAYLVAALLVAYVGFPAIFGGPSLLASARHWWNYGLEISLLLSAAVSWSMASFWPRLQGGLARPSHS